MGFALWDAAFNKQPDYAGEAAKLEEQRQKRIQQGTNEINQIFGRYDQGFFDQRAKAYQDYAMPQLAQQYGQTRDQIAFNLANRGLSKSSAANKQWSDLFRNMQSAKQGIVDTGRGQAMDLRRQLDTAKGTLLNQLYQSADPAQAAQQAVSTAASFSAPSSFAPIANQFSGLLNQYVVSQLLRNQPGYGGVSGGGPSAYGSQTPVTATTSGY
jgi:hypothetical protein